MWFWIIVIAGFFKSIHFLLDRLILRDEKESYSFAFFLQIVSVLMLIPLVLLDLKLPKDVFSYFILLVVGIVDTLSGVLIRESIRLLEISLRTIIYQIRIFFVLGFAFVFLNEGLSLAKIMGSVLIFLGIALAVFKRRKMSWFRKAFVQIFRRKEQKATGVFLTLAGALVTALELIGFKYLFSQFSLGLTLFSISLISAIVYLLIFPNITRRALNLVRGKKAKIVFLDGFIANTSWILFFWATSMAEVGKTLSITQGFMVLTVLGGIVFLNERERIWQKILGGILAAIGVVLVKEG